MHSKTAQLVLRAHDCIFIAFVVNLVPYVVRSKIKGENYLYLIS